MLKKSSWIIVGILFSLCAQAQDQDGNSPYSRFGIGDMNITGITRYIGMASTGVANPDSSLINNINPAFIGNNHFTTFEAGLVGNYNMLTEGSNKQNLGNVRFNDVAMSFPIIHGQKKKVNWSMSLGYKPYSVVNYASRSLVDISGDSTTATVEYAGTGGVNKLHFSNGFNICENFFLGLESSFLFGAINRSVASQITGETDVSVYNERVSHKGLKFKAGLGYRGLLKGYYVLGPVAYKDKNNDSIITYEKLKEEDIYINGGLVVDFGKDIGAKSLSTIEVQNRFGQVLSTDTITNQTDGSVSLPLGISGGISLERIVKKYKYGAVDKNDQEKTRRWLYNLDLSFYNWESYQNFSDVGGLNNSYSMAIGIEYTPNYASDNLYKTQSYQIGLRYTKLPYTVNGTDINDIGMTFGVSLPVSISYGPTVSRINVAVETGIRGQNSDGLIQQVYINGHVSFTINTKTWFRRRKIN